MRNRLWAAALAAAAIAFASAAWGQSGTPLPVLPGYLATAGCPSSNLSPCFRSLAVGSGLVSGAASATGTAATTIIAAQGTGVKIYITGVQCGRNDAGTTASTVTFDDGAATTIVLPNAGSGGINTISFNTPLVVAANTAFTFQSSASITTVYCNAQGYIGS
jgi:hypothetical protein